MVWRETERDVGNQVTSSGPFHSGLILILVGECQLLEQVFICVPALFCERMLPGCSPESTGAR